MLPQVKRVNYFSGQLLTTADLQAEQVYFIEKLKRHNQYLHGFGVAQGLEVSLSDSPPGEVIVQPGMAIDQCGHEVVLSSPQRGPLPEVGKKAFLILSWAERETDFIPAMTGEGEGETTAASRVEEYAELKYEATRPDEEGVDSGNRCGITLARLKKRGGVWRADLRFEVRRVRG